MLKKTFFLIEFLARYSRITTLMVWIVCCKNLAGWNARLIFFQIIILMIFLKNPDIFFSFGVHNHDIETGESWILILHGTKFWLAKKCRNHVFWIILISDKIIINIIITFRGDYNYNITSIMNHYNWRENIC